MVDGARDVLVDEEGQHVLPTQSEAIKFFSRAAGRNSTMSYVSALIGYAKIYIQLEK